MPFGKGGKLRSPPLDKFLFTRREPAWLMYNTFMFLKRISIREEESRRPLGSLRATGLLVTAAAGFFLLGSSTLVPAEVPTGNQPIVIMGDSQHSDPVHRQIIAAVLKENPVAVFQAGDLTDNGFSEEAWARFNKNMALLRARVRYYPALGNHEGNSPLYYKNFDLPNNERWYSVDEDGIHFIVLDSNAPLDRGGEQYRWLTEDLKKAQDKSSFIILIFHHPLFTTSRSHVPDEQGWARVLLPILREYHVDAVFNGHCHNYERSFYDGVYHIVTGGAGSHLKDQGRPSRYSQKFIEAYHFCLLSREGDTLVISVKDPWGDLLDRFQIHAKKRGQALRMSGRPERETSVAGQTPSCAVR